MAKRAIMAGWLRPAGTRWIRRSQQHEARVTLGTGGWHWEIRWRGAVVVAESQKPTRRSRKARRQAQRVLFGLIEQARTQRVTLKQTA
jgi:hypothetical protein